MIRSLLKRTKFHRAALPLLAMLLTTTSAWAETETVTYIKADGTSSTQEATILTGNEIEIGSSNQTTWYVVKNTQEGVDVAYTKPKTLRGTVNIILEDGAEMTATSGGTTIWGVVGSTLNIYGQTNGTGRLSSESTAYQAIGTNGDINIYGGVISASTTGSLKQAILANDASVNIYGGTVTATSSSGIAIRATTAVNIHGGTVTATGYQGISAGSITLGWTNHDDYIKANSYEATNGITIAPGRKLTDDTNVYRGVLSSTQISALANQTLTPKGWEGDGSVTTPYQITDSDDLLLLAYNVNQGETYEDKYFKLTDNIKFDRSTDADDITSTENNFPAIGDAYQKNGFWEHEFKGHFDGNNKTISGIRIYKGGSGHADAYVGLFGKLGKCAVVKDLKLADCRITGHYYTGGIVGQNFGGTITNCHVDNTVYIHAAQDGACYHGGIAGGIYSNKEKNIVSTISKCTSKVQLTVFDGIDLNPNSSNPTTNYGGIVGANMTGTLVDNYVEGATIPKVESYYGGIAGNNDVSDIRNYYKECTIAGVPRQTNMACGDPKVNGGIDVTYRLVSNGKKIGDADALTLQISGTGAMADYSEDKWPWHNMRNNITDIVISDGVTTIGKNAFLDCANLASIKISSDVKTIGERAFMHCWALTDVTIPASVESIGDQAFADCETLKTIHMKNPDAPTLVADVRGINYNFSSYLEGILTPSAEAMNNYASAKGWSAYADKLGAEGYCGDKNENGGKNVKWSLMPTGKKTQYNELLYALNIDVNPDVENQTNFNMGNADYRNQTNNPWLNMRDFISELNIGEGVTSIAEQAFNSLIIISSVVIPRSIEKIAGSAFGDESHACRNLEWVYMKRYDPTAEKKITNLDFFEGKCNTFIGCPELKCIFVDNIDAYNAATSADYWDDDMKAKLRKYKPTLFAAGATNEWATFCADIEYAKPDGCTIYTVSGVNSEQVQVAEVEGDVIPACTPVLIKRAAGKISDDIKAEFSAIVDIDDKGWAFNCDIANYYSYYASGPISAMNTVPYSYMDLQFNYHNDNVSDGSITYYSHFFGNTGSATAKVSYIDIDNEYYSVFALYGDKFLRLDALNGIPANRCIIQVDNDLFYDSDPAATRSLTIGVGGDTTGMEELKNEKIEELNSEWYDLQGRKLGSKPTRKGLYINNGKKIVIK